MNWNQVARTIRLVFLLRVPLLMLVLLAAFGPVASSTSVTSNLLDQAGKGLSLFLVSFAAFLLAFTCLTCLNLVLYYGRHRFGELATVSPHRPLITFLAGCAAAITLDACVYRGTKPHDIWNVLPLVAGLLVAFVLVIAAKLVQLALTDPRATPHPPPYLVFPAYLFRPLEAIFDDIYCWSSKRSDAAKGLINQASQWPLGILEHAGQGYFIEHDGRPAHPLRLQSGHVFAASLTALAFACYLVIGYTKSHITAEDAKIPALAFVLLFLIVACWSLAALAFFFDRYRFPLFTVLLLLSSITWSVPQSDHFFRVEELSQRMAEPPSGAEYLSAQLNKGHKRLIFVATPGGGIQAAAWTAKVLTELNGRYPNFRDSVAVISSVSGGSLGAMIYGASFVNPAVPAQDVPKNATRSAIDEVAWGWTVPDFWRTVIPWLRIHRAVDRGWALEKKWAAINGLKDDGGTSGTFLAEWSGVARRGDMPALIINSMLVERGEPVVFSTTRFPKQNSDRIINFYDLYGPERRGLYDIRVNTAARLSAAFSYVAPASRPSLDGPFGPGYHFVDGGYYDNYGINSLLSWLDEGLSEPPVKDQVKDVLILRIRHFNQAKQRGPTVEGWGLQLVAPILALYNMRDFAQNSVAENQLAFFGRYYAQKNVRVWKATLDYDGRAPCSDAPLSWKLDADQIECIQTTWKRAVEEDSKSLLCISDYLSGVADPHCTKAADMEER